MSHLLDYSIPGIPYGCEIALMAVGLVLTFRATGVFNLAFGAQAFVAAFAYDLLNRYDGLSQGLAFFIAVLLVSPALGLAMDRFLFRFIPTASMTAKIVSSLGLLIAIPELIPILFGDEERRRIAYLWLNPNVVDFHVAGTPVNGEDISTVIFTVVVVAALIAMFRWTRFGLEMRAVVESRRMSQLQGVNAPWVAAGAWALSSALAGLAGVLLLPAQNTIDPTAPLAFTTLLVAGMTAAALASMRSIPLAAVAGVVIGVIEIMLQNYLPSGNVLKTGILPALPFLLLVGALVLNRNLRNLERSSDPLASVDPPPPPPAVSIRDRRLDAPSKWGWRILLVVFFVSMLTWVPDNWVFPFSQGMVYSTIFLSVTLITGMSGQLSLCQATFAGIGGFTAGQLALHHGVPVLVGAVIGGAFAAGVGAVVSLVVVRVSGLLLTLVTLAFALFADNVLFLYNWSGGGSLGVQTPRPQIGPINFSSDRSFLMLATVVLLLAVAMVMLVQRGTTGRYLAAMRGSPTAAASLGINLTYAKVTVFALSAGIAGLGGALYASNEQLVSPGDFYYVLSLVFVVAVITTGSRSVEGALQAGIAFSVIMQILTYVPQRLSGIEFILFAFGALTYAKHPEGIVEYQKTRWLNRVARLLEKWDERRGRESSGPAGRRELGPYESPGLSQPVPVQGATGA
jgi:branched-chain amino acid transport system permease protein